MKMIYWTEAGTGTRSDRQQQSQVSRWPSSHQERWEMIRHRVVLGPKQSSVCSILSKLLVQMIISKWGSLQHYREPGWHAVKPQETCWTLQVHSMFPERKNVEWSTKSRSKLNRVHPSIYFLNSLYPFWGLRVDHCSTVQPLTRVITMNFMQMAWQIWSWQSRFLKQTQQTSMLSFSFYISFYYLDFIIFK